MSWTKRYIEILEELGYKPSDKIPEDIKQKALKELNKLRDT